MSEFLKLTQKTVEFIFLALLILFLGCAPEYSSAQQPQPIPNPQRNLAQVVQDLAWTPLPGAAESSPVRIWSSGERGGAAFVVTHGMGGTQSGDRFHQLATAIHRRFPDAWVLRIDWTERASSKTSGLPNPWKVAASIDEIATLASKDLVAAGIAPQRSTFIGESFGNWVNARIAGEVGGVQRILAINPASEVSGYRPPDLRKAAKRSCSFHTYSVFDTTLEIAESDILLALPEATTDLDRHVAGIPWLAARLDAGDASWLEMDRTLPKRKAGHFQAAVTDEGTVLDQQPLRKRPIASETGARSQELVAAK